MYAHAYTEIRLARETTSACSVAHAQLYIWGEPERAPPSRLNGCAVYIWAMENGKGP